jgi:hypothetical protein
MFKPALKGIKVHDKVNRKVFETCWGIKKQALDAWI